MLQKLRNNPLLTAALVIVLYALWFIIPSFFIHTEHKVMGVKEATALWPLQLGVGIVLALIITALGWWKEIGFRAVNEGGSKFLLFPFLMGVLMIGSAWAINKNPHIDLGYETIQPFLMLFLVMLMVGFTEESIFRGILFHGLETKLQPFAVVLLTAIIFGLFHFVNLFNGNPFDAIAYQVIHAASVGFLYAALRLRLGAIWPIMLVHGFWDTSVFVFQTAQTANGIATVASSTTFSAESALTMALPELLYGLFVYWRWTAWSGKSVVQK